MSYRNDHDAAIARVDALTHELDQTQAERERLQAEREQLQSEVDRLRDSPLRPRVSRSRFAFTLLAILAGIAIEEFGHDHHRRHAAPPPPPAAAQPELRVPRFAPPPSLAAPATRPASTTPAAKTPAATTPASTRSITTPARAPAAQRTADAYDVHVVAACAANTQRAVDSIATLTDLRTLRASCRRTIESVVRDGAISADARRLLTRWLELEDRLVPSLAAYNTYVLRDPAGTHYRAPDALRDEFHAALRARSAVLAAVPDSLQPR